jgi:alpha-1,2-mannosyltransferase
MLRANMQGIPTSALRRRLCAYAQIFSNLATWPALLVWWGWFAIVFLRNMISRAGHLSSAGMRILDLPCASPLCDFSVFWQAGLMASQGQPGAVYQPTAFMALRQILFPPQADAMPWYYPPPALLTVMAVSHLPFEPAFWVWSLTLTLLAVLLLFMAGVSKRVVVLALLSPAALWNLQLGQFGIVCGAALVAGLLASAARPGLTGLALAGLVIKPQSALLAPVALLAAGRWKALLAAGTITVFLLLACTASLGWPIWSAYLGQGLAASRLMLVTLSRDPGTAQFAVSVFGMARSLGAGMPTAEAVQGIATLTAILLTWRVWRSNMGQTERVALCVFLSLLATPYGYVDDMVGYSIALAMLAQQRSWRIDFPDVIFWLWPAFCPVVYNATGVQFTPVVVALTTWRSWRRAVHGAAPAP